MRPNESGRLATKDLAVRRNSGEVQPNGGFPLSLDNLHRQRCRQRKGNYGKEQLQSAYGTPRDNAEKKPTKEEGGDDEGKLLHGEGVGWGLVEVTGLKGTAGVGDTGLAGDLIL